MKPTIKKILKEALFDSTNDNQMSLLNDFVEFANRFLKIETRFKIHIEFTRNNLVTTAAYGNKNIFVYGNNRALVDIMRSIAHEMVHLAQDIEGRLNPNDHDKNNADGSPIENEANAKAGEMIRIFGKKFPEIYE